MFHEEDFQLPSPAMYVHKGCAVAAATAFVITGQELNSSPVLRVLLFLFYFIPFDL